jgi:hypothetical protein
LAESLIAAPPPLADDIDAASVVRSVARRRGVEQRWRSAITLDVI